MSQRTRGYLRKRAVTGPWLLEAQSLDGIRRAVVIPAYDEYPTLFDTLADLAAQPPAVRDETLVAVVVNNRVDAPVDALEANQLTLEGLRNMAGQALRLGIVDAASPGQTLPKKGGVGWARRIGLDLALRALEEQGQSQGPLISLDADARIDADYLSALRDFFDSESRWAAVMDYAHPTEGEGPETAAIIQYELYLRYHELGLRHAASPYAFHSIGSTMACTGEAYAAVSGMNRRMAGEDFYFLQQLAKTGRVEHITQTTVHPSPRPSHRVPFGTGNSVQRFLDSGADPRRVYHPESYRILRAWLRHVEVNPAGRATVLLDSARNTDAALGSFLEQAGFVEVWQRLQNDHPETQRFLRHFHQWFDGFRTLKLIHHLREQGYPEVDLFDAIAELVRDCGLNLDANPASGQSADLARHKRLLSELRAHMRLGT